MTSDDPDDDKVGYRRPPKRHRFQKGRSGNPAGRRPKSKNIDTLFSEELGRKISLKRPDGTVVEIIKREAIVMKAVEGALKGNPRQLENVLKYLRTINEPEPFSVLPNDELELTRMLQQLSKPKDP